MNDENYIKTKEKLNLGPFSKYIDYLSDGTEPKYVLSNCDTMVFGYDFDYGGISLNDGRKVENYFVIPIFDIGAETGKEYLDKGIVHVLEVIEIAVIQHICLVIDKADHFCRENKIPISRRDNLHIPIRDCRIFVEKETGVAYGWVEIGIAFFVEMSNKGDEQCRLETKSE